MGLMIAIVRGIKPDPSNKFWSSFHGTFVYALSRAFSSLVRAGESPAEGMSSPVRPYLDWRLFAMLRSCCLGLDKACKNSADTRKLDSCYAAAAAQLRAFTLRACGVVASGTGGQQRSQPWDAFDGFFAAMEPAMPMVESKWGSSREVIEERGSSGRRRTSVVAGPGEVLEERGSGGRRRASVAAVPGGSTLEVSSAAPRSLLRRPRI